MKPTLQLHLPRGIDSRTQSPKPSSHLIQLQWRSWESATISRRSWERSTLLDAFCLHLLDAFLQRITALRWPRYLGPVWHTRHLLHLRVSTYPPLPISLYLFFSLYLALSLYLSLSLYLRYSITPSPSLYLSQYIDKIIAHNRPAHALAGKHIQVVTEQRKIYTLLRWSFVVFQSNSSSLSTRKTRVAADIQCGTTSQRLRIDIGIPVLCSFPSDSRDPVPYGCFVREWTFQR